MNKKLFIPLGLLFLILLDFQIVFSRIGSDPSHMEVVATLSFENEPLSVAVNEMMGQVYIGDETGFFVIDSATDTIVDHVSLGFDVRFIAVNPVMNHIYVNGYGAEAVLYVLDGATHSVVGDINITTSPLPPWEFALNPTMDRIYISANAIRWGQSANVMVYDAQNFSFLGSIEVPDSSGGYFIEDLLVAVNPQMNLLYITWGGDDSTHLIDCETNEIVKTVTLQNYGNPMIVNPATGYVYIGHLVLDGTSLEELTQLPDYIEAVNPTDNLVICSDDRAVSILDATSHELFSTLALEWELDDTGSIQNIAMNTVTGKIYVVHNLDKKVSVVDIRSGSHNHVVINEFELNPPGDDEVTESWVEFYNPTSSDVDISDCILRRRQYTFYYVYWGIPSDTVIEAGGYYLFVLEKSTPKNEYVWLEVVDSEGKIIDRTPVKSDLEDDDRTWQRSPDGCDYWVFQKSTKHVTEDVAPVADTGGPYGGEVDDSIWFDGSGSYDLDGEIVLCEWDFGDGTTKEGTYCYHVYEESGTYTVTLTVTDAVGNIGTDQTTVTILPSEEISVWPIEPVWVIVIIFLAAVIVGITVTAILLRRRRK